MGPGTIRCLAHSAWPMLRVMRQCALSPYPLLSADCLLRMALAAVAETAGITTLRPNFGSRKRQERERASAGCESPSGRAIWARSAAQNPRRTCCFRRRARRERSSTPLRSGVAHSSSIIMHALGLCEPWGADYEPAAMAAARKVAE